MRLLVFLLGYRYYFFKKEDILLLSKIALKGGFVTDLGTGKIKIPLYKCRKFERLIGKRLSYTKSEARGVLGFFVNNIRNVPLIISLLSVLILWYFSSLAVWDVRISGNEIYSAELIEKELDT